MFALPLTIGKVGDDDEDGNGTTSESLNGKQSQHF